MYTTRTYVYCTYMLWSGVWTLFISCWRILKTIIFTCLIFLLLMCIKYTRYETIFYLHTADIILTVVDPAGTMIWCSSKTQLLLNGTKMDWKSLVISDFVIPDLQNGQKWPKCPQNGFMIFVPWKLAKHKWPSCSAYNMQKKLL